MADVVIQPSFPSTEFDRLKSELLTDLQQQKDEPGAVATRIFYDKVYSEGHPYRYQETGTEATVQGLSPDDVKAFYRAAYAPTNATLVFVGDLTMADAVKIANDFFGKWQKKNVQPAAIPASGMGRSLKFYLIDKPGAAQSQIRIGNVAVPRNSEDYFAVSLLQQILGSSNGRLFLNLRESHGYTYGAYAQFNMRRAAGPFMAYAGVKSEITDSAMIEFMKELKRVREELVPEEEFTMYKNAVIQRLPRIFETPTQISGQLGSVVLYDLPDDYFNSLVERYQAVTREDVQRVARKYITPEALTIVVVGDAAQITGKLNAMGAFAEGKVKLKGDLGVAMKLMNFFKLPA
jgi:predicted Zn-dependent peptidase